MNYSKIMMFCITLMSFAPAHAELYMELAVDGGGDVLASTTTGDSLYAGGGVKLAIGSLNRLDDSTALRVAAGYLFDTLDAVDGHADSSAIILDGMYLINNGPHVFGIGVTAHLSPEYTQSGGGYADIKIKFDDAVGLALEYQYMFSNNLGVGVRYTDLSYESGNLKLDAGSVGLFLSTGF